MNTRIRKIIKEEADYFGITVEQLLGPSRRREYVEARNRAIVRTAEGRLSTVQIGKIFNRHHTTILYTLGRLSGRKGGR